jgi:hypothetical protein
MRGLLLHGSSRRTIKGQERNATVAGDPSRRKLRIYFVLKSLTDSRSPHCNGFYVRQVYTPRRRT